MTIITRELIEEARRNGASEEEIQVLENQLLAQEGEKVNIEKEKNDHIANRKNLENELRGAGLQESDIIRELQNYDDEQTLKTQNKVIDGEVHVVLENVNVVSERKAISDILNVEDYNNKTTSGNAVEKTNNWLNSYIGNRGFKAEDPSIFKGWNDERNTLPPGEYTRITAANGNIKYFNLEPTPYGIKGEVNPISSLEDITTWLDSQEISSKQRYIHKLTNQTPREDGLYDIKLINKKDINTGTIVRPIPKELQFDASIDKAYSASEEELEVITNLIHSSIEKAITNPESLGLNARYSSVRAGELSEDDKDEIRTTVFNRVNKMLDVEINKEDFNKLFGMYDGIVQQINTENNNYKNLSVSGEKVDEAFKQERLELYVKNLSSREKVKYGLLRQIEEKERELDKLKDTTEREIKISEINDLKNEIAENAKIETPVIMNPQLQDMYKNKPPTTVVENPELASMMFNNDYNVEAIEEASELAEEFKGLSVVELAILAKSLPSTMTDKEVYQHYHDNILKIRRNTEKEFLDKKITLSLWKIDSPVLRALLQKFPQAREKNKFEVLQKAIDKIKFEILDHKYDIGEPMRVSDIFRTLKNCDGVLDVVSVSISRKRGSSYSTFSYDVEGNTSPDGRLILGREDIVFEVKFPNSDIVGTVK